MVELVQERFQTEKKNMDFLAGSFIFSSREDHGNWGAARPSCDFFYVRAGSN